MENVKKEAKKLLAEIYNDYNHIYIANNERGELYGYYNECPIYLIYDYLKTFFKKYNRRFTTMNCTNPMGLKVENNLGLDVNYPRIGCIYYNKRYQEYYIFIDKAFVNCAGKYKQDVYNRILFHELGHMFNKDIGRVMFKYMRGKKYVKRSKERRADKMGQTLMKMYGVDTSHDAVYTHILKRTQKVYRNKYDNSVGHNRHIKLYLALVKRYKLLYRQRLTTD